MGLRVALLYNLKANAPVQPDAPGDGLAEYDCLETVEGLLEALRSAGHHVIPLEADVTLPDTLREARPDICFNIAEGHRGDAREAHVPALLEMLSIPYTGSKVLAQALSLDKAATKRMWRDAALPTAPFQVMARGDERLLPDMEFPLFVKPLREGSGMGINGSSVAVDEVTLRDQVRWVIGSYRQPALVEAFLPGREFTLGLLGNRTFPGEPPREGYDADGYHVFPALEIDVSPVAEAGGLYGSYAKTEKPLELGYLCPAPIEEQLAVELRKLAVAAFEAIGALDVSRVDFRLGLDGRPYLLEINTLPGLNPTYSDIVIAARAERMGYGALVNRILDLAVQRYGLAESRSLSYLYLSSDRSVLQG